MAAGKESVGNKEASEILLSIMELASKFEELTGKQVATPRTGIASGKPAGSDGVVVNGGLEGKRDRLIRLKEVLELVPVCKSTWWAGVKTGRYPAPVHHLGPRITAWSMSSIMQLVNGGEGKSHG